jgi:hypothetical protein
MARKLVDIGVEGNDGTGDSIREGFRKVNENFKEIYAVFGQEGTLAFLDLGDVEGGTLSSYSSKKDHLPIVDGQGTGLVFKKLQGENGLTITYPEDPADPNFGKIVLTQQLSTTTLGGPGIPATFGNYVDGQGYVLGNIADPTPENVFQWNTAYGRNNATVISPDKFPVPLGYADRRYINKGTVPGELADTMTGYLAVPAGATGDQVPQANETVLKIGGKMTGNLFLNDHPGDLSGAGTPLGADDLQAATKYYVDTTAYSSPVNLYVSTSGDDTQRKTPVGKEGRAWAYAYKSLVAACLRAEQLIDESPWEAGPYRQLIAYGNGAQFSTVVPGGIIIGGGLNGTTRVKFTNDNGSPVDQGIQSNKDINPGKIVIGRNSGARGFIVKYATDALNDYVDLRDVTGTFTVGENLYFDQPVKRLEISIFIESGNYYEDFPIRIPRNCSILGDEFRRTVIRPADRISKSPWAATWFYRDLIFDNLVTAETNWGYHYLTDATNKASLPKNNKDLDVFLMNDATIIRQISCQGHGGFMMVLDPNGQILTKSPYCQQSGSFAGSLNKQRFAGGQYVDGQSGSMPVTSVSTNLDKTEITVTEAFRVPQTPTSFFVNGTPYKIDTFTDNGGGYRGARELLLLNKEFIVAETIAYVNDVITPTFTYDATKFSRDVGYIIGAVAWDIAFNSNIQSINVGLEYYIRIDDNSLAEQKTQTLAALGYVKESLVTLLGDNAVAASRAGSKMDIVIQLVSDGIEPNFITPIIDATGWSYNGTTVTVTATGGHGLKAGWSVKIVDAVATSNAPNGVFNVATVVDENIFTYTAALAPTGTASGTLRFSKSPIPLRSIPTPPADPQALPATIDGINNSLARLLENRDLVVAEYIAFINTEYPDFLFGNIGVVGYRRDIDRIINSVTYDAIYGGNSQTLIVAKNFFDIDGRSNISQEVTQIYRALEWTRTVASQVVLNIQLTNLLQVSIPQVRGLAGSDAISARVSELFNVIITAIRFGIDTVPDLENPLIDYVSTSLQSAKSRLDINSTSIRADTISFINSRFLYDQFAAKRDVRFLIDDLAHDIVYTGNLKMIEHGLSYFVADAPYVSDAERPRTLAIIDYVKQLSLSIVDNIDIPSIQSIKVGNLIVGQTYKINDEGSTVWTDLGAADNNHNTVFTATATGLVTAGNFVVGRAYTIINRGTTNFITVGASSNAVGTSFIASTVGDGTGTAAQGTGNVILASASPFYRRQFGVSQTIQLTTGGTGPSTLLPSLTWVGPSLLNAFTALGENRTAIQTAIIEWINGNISSNVNNTGSIWYGFTYNSGTCSRDIGLVIDAISYDMIFNSNFRSVRAGNAYYRAVASAQLVLATQKAATLASFQYLKNYVQSVINPGTYGSLANSRIGAGMDIIIDILNNTPTVAPEFSLPEPSDYTSDYRNAKTLIIANRANGFIIEEIHEWINTQIAGNITPFTTSFTYNQAACERDLNYILDGITYDLTYGGNLETLVTANAYFVGAVSTLGAGEKDKTIATYLRLKEVIGKVAQGITILDKNTVIVQNTSGSGGSAEGSVAFAQDRVQDIIKKIDITAVDSKPKLEELVTTTRTMVANTKGSGYVSAKDLLVANRDFIKAEVYNYLIYTYTFEVTSSTITEFTTDSTANMRVGMPVLFLGTDSFEQTILSATTPLEVDGKFVVTFTFDRQNLRPDPTQDYEVFGNVNAKYNSILPIAVVPDQSATNTTTTSITVVYPTNPGVFDYANVTKIRVSGGTFGGVNRDDKYYIRTLNVNGTSFTITKSITYTVNGNGDSVPVPGAIFNLDSDTGLMYCRFAFDETLSRRDTGFVVSNIATDILYGGRYNTIKAGKRFLAASSYLVTSEQTVECRAGISYINTLAQSIITNTSVTPSYQALNGVTGDNLVTQTINLDLENGINAATDIAGLVTVVTDIIENNSKTWVDQNLLDAIVYPKYVLQLNEDTPYDTNKSGALPDELVIQGAGNTSMLSNDWTQLNDLGYGLVATNNGLIETVSVFTYYCWTAYYANKGGQIRSVGGSNAHGEYGCVAEGSDPFEVPDSANLSDDMAQVARIFKSGPFAAEMTKTKTTVYIDSYGYVPYNVGEIEINHGYDLTDGVLSNIGTTRYEIASITDVSATYFSTNVPAFSDKSLNVGSGKYRVTFTFPLKASIPDTGRYYVISGNSNTNYNNVDTGWLCVASAKNSITLEFTSSDPGVFGTTSTSIRLKPATILRLNLNTSGSNNTAASGLQKDLEDNQIVTIRSNQNFKFFNIDNISPTRPSTALVFKQDPLDNSDAPVYRVLAFNTKDSLSRAMALNDPVINNEVILTFDQGYQYISLVIDQEHNTLTEAQAGIDGGSTTRTLGSLTGDKYLAIEKINSARELQRILTGEMAFAWNGRIHRVKSYLPRTISSTEGYAIIGLVETRAGTNGYTTNDTYQDLIDNHGTTGITVATRPGEGFDLAGGVYTSVDNLITYAISGTEVAPPAPVFTASISSTTLTITEIKSSHTYNGGTFTSVSSRLQIGSIIQNITGSGIASGTKVIGQLTASAGSQASVSMAANVTTTATSASSDTNFISVSTTAGLVNGMPVVFTGTTFGNVVSGVVYYVKAVTTLNRFSITSTVGGTAIALGTTTGSMTVTAGTISGSKVIILGSINTNIVVGQFVTGTNVPTNTYVQSVDTTKITLTNALTGNGAGTYNFYTAGQAGTYTISSGNSTVSSQTMGVTYTAYGNSNASYNISGPVLESTVSTIKIGVATASAVASIAADGTMIVDYVSNANTLQLGQAITGTGISVGTYIKFQNSGTTGGAGTYTLSAVPTTVSPTITGYTASTVLTVVSLSTGTLLVSNDAGRIGAIIQKTSGSGITAGTIVTGQITSGVTTCTTPATGTNGTNILQVNSTVGVNIGSLVTGFGVPEDTYVTGINIFAVTISRNLTQAAVGGDYVFGTAGVAGTYRINQSQTVGSVGSPITIKPVFTFVPGVFGSTASRIYPTNTLYNPALVQDNTITLKAGLSKGEPTAVIINISTCRVTSHDFSEIGSGGYNQTNYPNKVYGPGKAKNQRKEVAERGTGRVFWVSTDQDGFFRVGRFFTVDQGTGTVTFAASLALSNLDGLGFKRGRAISEFSDDDTFQDNSDNKVPTEHAIDGYINRRLGIDRNNIIVSEGTLGAGFLDRNGILEMNGDIKMNQFSVVNLLPIDAEATPDDYAVRKDYVDNQQLSDKQVDTDGNIRNDILIYNSDRVKPGWVNAKSSTDNSQVQISLLGDKELNVFVKRETIDNTQISKDANITQDKVDINVAATQRDQGTFISGVTKSVGLLVNSAEQPLGNSPTITIKFILNGSPTPTIGIYYTVSGNSNLGYNGKFLCVAASPRVGNVAAFVTLQYPENPGVFGASATTVTPWETTVTTQLDHGFVAGDTVSISGSTVAAHVTDATGVVNTNVIIVTTNNGAIGTGQLVTGYGVSDYTYVKSVNGVTITLTKKLTATATGSYSFSTSINGNWPILASVTSTTFVIGTDTRISGNFTVTGARATKLGLTTFNKNQFNVTNGFVELRTSATVEVTATVTANSNIVTVSSAAMTSISIGNVITIKSGAINVVMPTTTAGAPVGTKNIVQAIPVTVTAITSATTFTVSTAFGGAGSSSSAILNVISGTPLSSIQRIETDRILGNLSGNQTSPNVVTTGEVVKAGDGIKNDYFNVVNRIGYTNTNTTVLADNNTDLVVEGVMTLKTRDLADPWKNTYGIFQVTSSRAANSIVRTNSQGQLDATAYLLDGILAFDSSGGANIDFYTPGLAKFLTASGNAGIASNPIISIGTYSTAVNTTVTVNNGGVFTVASTSNMYLGQEIVISGATTFGGFSSTGTYYITAVGVGTISISASDTLSPAFVGVNGSGSMTVASSGVLNGQIYVPKIKAIGTVTLNPVNSDVSLQPRTTNNVDGRVIINPAVNGSINNMTIGATIESPGTFTTVTVTSVADSNNPTTGPLKVAGGAAIAKKLYVGSDLNVSGDTFIRGNLTVDGVTTSVNSNDLTVDDKNIVLAAVSVTGTTNIGCGNVDGSGVATSVQDTNGLFPSGLIPGMTVTKVSGTAVMGTGAVTISAVGASTVTFAVVGSITPGTFVFTAAGGNTSTADGGGITLIASTNGSADKTIKWLSASNRWTFNVGIESTTGIENTPIGSLLRADAKFLSVDLNGNLIIGDADTDTITINSQFVTGSQLKTAKAANSTLSLSPYDVDGAVYKDLIKVTAGNSPFVTIVSDGLGTIDGIDIGQTSHKKGKFTELQATSTVTFTQANANTTISPSGTGTVTISPSGTGTVTISPVAEGSINNMSIGATTPKAGAFTTLAANAQVSFTAGTESGSKTQGTVVITGGLGVSGNIYATSINAAITGDLNGTAAKATQVATVNAGDVSSNNYYFTLVNANNATAAQMSLYTDGTLSYNPATNILTTGTFNGALSGNASTASQVKTIDSGDTNQDYFITYVDTNSSSSTAKTVYTNAGIKVNPNSDTITASRFSGNVTGDVTGKVLNSTGTTVLDNSTGALSGNATSSSYWATARTMTITGAGMSGTVSIRGDADMTLTVTQSARSASSIDVAEQGSTSVAQYLTFVASLDTARPLKGNGNITFKPDTNTLTCPNFAGTASAAKYADLAENYQADAEYEEGTVLVFGGDEEVTASTQFNDRRVAGVVSLKPAYLMNSELEGTHVVAIALQGRVPVKVIGRVQKGDLLVTSGRIGFAIVNNDPKVGTVIGKALEAKTTDGDGVIEAVVGKH